MGNSRLIWARNNNVYFSELGSSPMDLSICDLEKAIVTANNNRDDTSFENFMFALVLSQYSPRFV